MSKELEKIRTEETVERIATRLMFAKPVPGLKNYRDECMFMPHQFGPMWVPLATNDDISFFAPEAVNSPEIVWPMNIGYAYERTTREDGQEIGFNYWQSMPAKKLRGRVRFTAKRNIAWFHGRLGHDNSFLSAVMYAAWTGHRWKTAPLLRYDSAFLDAVKDAGMAIRERHIDKGEDDIGERAAMGQSVALTMRYEWGAQFSIPGSPRVIVPTTPRGILELFNDREKPAGNDRRKALKHWVREHVRKSKAGSFRHVIDHLRGEMEFKWRGFDVRIRPAQYDLETIEAKRK